MRLKFNLIALLVSGAVCLSSCSSGFMKSLAEVHKLQQQLMDKYDEKEVNVNLMNSAYLTIAFVNSPLNQQDETRRAARADDAAKFIVRSFPSIQKIQTIWILFMASETKWVVFHHSRSLNAFMFNNRGERRTGAPANIASESDDPLSPTVKYNSARNETDIGLTRIQLSGDPDGDGIALVPYFTAKGDARGPVRTATAPATVVFDFASYSHQKLFAGDAPLEIICDGRVEFDTTARLLLPKDSGSEGTNAQFLTAEIPFNHFAAMAHAQRVRLKLNNQSSDLRPDAIAALKHLTDLVAQTPSAGR